MHSSLSRSSARLLTPLLFASFVAVAPSACAAEKPSGGTLQLQVDAKPIDRNAADRVSYAPMLEKVAGSIVYVYSTKEVRRQDLAPFLDDPRFRRFFGVPGPRGGPLPPQQQHGLGSGVVISRDGYILTNNHVVEGADEVKVSIGESNRRYDAKVVGGDALADVAVLKIEADGLAPATLGDSKQLKVGDVVLAIGNPFGVGQSVSSGIVSAVDRGGLGIEAIENFIQTDAAINPGNSGGALIDSAGRVVGINTAILSRSGGFAGVGFAIPINLARDIAEQLVRSGKVERGFLGIAPQTLSPELAGEFGANHGALIAEVTPDSPAAKAGLRTGDVITEVNGTEIRDPRQLLLTISQIAPGTKIEIRYLRDGKEQKASVELARRPDADVATDAPPGSGDGVLDNVAVADLTPEIRQQLRIPERVQGAIITQIDPMSPAARQGLREGDVILSLNRRPVKNAEEAVRLSEEIKGPKVLVLIWREGQSQFVVIDESEG